MEYESSILCARAEIDSIYSYITEHNATAAQRVKARIREVAEQLGDFPQQDGRMVGFVTVDPQTGDLDQIVVAPEVWGSDERRGVVRPGRGPVIFVK